MIVGDSLNKSRVVRALSHPLRLRLLEEITDAGEISPAALARRLDQPLATVSHHVRMLRDLGFLELTHTRPRRGAVEHFYRAVRRPFLDDDDWEELPLGLRRGLAHQTFRMFFAEAAQAAADGGFDDPGAHIVRFPLELDEQGRRELSDAMTRLLVQAEEVQARSDARFAAEGPIGAAGPSSLVLLHYRTAAPSSPIAPADGQQTPPRPRPRLPPRGDRRAGR